MFEKVPDLNNYIWPTLFLLWAPIRFPIDLLLPDSLCLLVYI